MKHSFVLLLIVALMFGGCSKEQTPEELAGQAAKTYYDRLLAGDYEGFLRGKVTSDSLPADYRSQLLTSYKQYKQTLDEMHGGVASVTISNTRNDSLMQMMQAFLLLHFKDSCRHSCCFISRILQKKRLLCRWCLRVLSGRCVNHFAHFFQQVGGKDEISQPLVG